MPRKKQIVQKQKRRKAYGFGAHSGDASRLKPKGFFRVFSNYKLYAILFGTALVAGLGLTAVYRTTSPNRNDSGTVRGEGVQRSTPEAGETSVTGAAANIKQYPAAPAPSLDEGKTYVATIKTDKGDIKVELLAKEAPETVNNFVFLARDKYYDGVTFHRVVGDLIAQSGDPTGTGIGGPGYDLAPERTDEATVAGILAAAPNGQGAGSLNNGSQFFFLLKDEPTYEGKFTVFGKVLSGLDVLEQLTPRDPAASNEAAPGDRIQTIEIQET
ncbi:MAG TPA: peptidylprolyl isomerase [Dehalococcoidia bacterium]|jgi:cyclophilin family peptidyl-prolyl cis-trans isomerase